ncbi:MAG: 30S ribosome-binding factor RbfA [Lachnospiraceae bacterium]|jgi:ribosome-binding factor A|nr:30S ribosome-binding factor RbfA [Lachnospiraceae bacterium]
MRKRSIKNIRVNQEVLRTISEILRNDIKDPRIDEFTSVIAVEVAPDLKTCKVYLSVLGDEVAREKTLEGVNSAEGYIRKKLASELNLRNTPKLTFFVDTSIEYGVEMSRKIDEVNKHDAGKSTDNEAE